MSILGELQTAMQDVEDQANHQGYWYCISDVLITMVCGMLCNLQTIDDIHQWSTSKQTKVLLKKQFRIKKLPCRAQFYNILGAVDPEKFSQSFIEWMQTVLNAGVAGKTVAIDGKTICSTDKLTKDGSVLHLASAIVSQFGLVIGTKECGTKTGEITAFRELIELLDVKGAVIVADALHCNGKSAEAVVSAGADYLFSVKDNVPNLKEEISLYVQNEEMESYTRKEKNGGRFEKRTAYVTREIDWLYHREHWKNIACIGAIHTEFTKNDKKSSEWHYYISSAPLTANELMTHARLEWRVEAMHWLLDVHFGEDKTRVWNMNIQKTLNLLRKIVLNLARNYKEKTKAKTPISGVLKQNLFDLSNLETFLAFFRRELKLD